MSERAKGRARVYPADEHQQDATVTNHAGLSADIRRQYGESADAANERAARLAAGWNLLVTLEEMEADQMLDVYAANSDVLGNHGEAVDLRRIATAIRTALSPSTPEATDG